MNTYTSNFRQILLSTVIFILLGVMLEACDANSTSPTPSSTIISSPTAVKTSTPVTLRWSYWGSDEEVEINKKIAAQFEKLHPEIKIEHLFVPFEQYFDKFKADWAGEKAPDVMFLSGIPNYAVSGLLENLDPYIQRDKAAFNLDDFYPNLLATFRYNGSLYGLPRDNDTKVIYYNKKMFDEANIPYPQPGWTWDALRSVAKKLVKRDASGNITRYGYAYEVKTWWRLWVYQNGGELYNDFSAPNPPTRFVLNSPQAAEAIQYWADMINLDQSVPPPSQLQTSGSLNDLFKQEKVAMVFGGHGKVKVFESVPSLTWDVVGLPAGKKRVNNAGGAGYTISKNSANKEAAWTFVRYLEGLEGQALYVGTGLIVGARRSVREDKLFVRRVEYTSQVFIEESELGKVNPQFYRAPEIDKIIDDSLAPVFEGKKTAAVALAELPAKVQPILEQAASGTK